MPQSRHRKINKAKKRPRTASGPQQNTRVQSSKNRNMRIIAMVLIAIFAVSVVAYVLTHRGSGEAGPVITTASGLKYVDLVQGNGASPQRGQTVTVNYVGTLENGKKFDSSSDHGQPSNFRLGVGEVIKGWDEGLMSMKVGGKRKLMIPSALGYGPMGRPPDIPGNSNLVFEVELLGVK